MDQLLEMLGFVMIGEVVDQRMAYRPEAKDLAGRTGAVYVFVNPDGRVWKVGKTTHGFSRVNYTTVFDGRGMRRPHEKLKLESIRREVQDGATQWVLPCGQPELIETLLTCLLHPTESNRRRSRAEKLLGHLTGG
jgi:hypothetical protein